MAKPRIEIDTASFTRAADELIKDATIQTQEEAEEIGKAMVKEVEQIVSAKFGDNPRHKINTTYLKNSFKYEVSSSGNGWEVALTIKPGVSSGKVGALERGRSGESKAYVIEPRNVPRALEFDPFDKAKYIESGGKIATKGQYAGRAFKPKASRTSAGASQGYGFMAEARANVLRRFGYDNLV